jgi:hypothetical protein
MSLAVFLIIMAVTSCRENMHSAKDVVFKMYDGNAIIIISYSKIVGITSEYGRSRRVYTHTHVHTFNSRHLNLNLLMGKEDSSEDDSEEQSIF